MWERIRQNPLPKQKICPKSRTYWLDQCLALSGTIYTWETTDGQRGTSLHPLWRSAQCWPLGSSGLNLLDCKLWSVLEDMVCWKRNNNLESLKKSLMKAVAEIYRQTVHAAIAVGRASQGLHWGRGGPFWVTLLLKNLKTTANKLFGSKEVDVFFHSSSRSQYTYNKTYGRTRQKWGSWIYNQSQATIYASSIWWPLWPSTCHFSTPDKNISQGVILQNDNSTQYMSDIVAISLQTSGTSTTLFGLLTVQ